MKINEQIKLAQEKLLAKHDELSALIAKGLEMTDEELTQAETLKAEVKGMEARIALLKEEEVKQIEAAKVVGKAGGEGVTKKIEVVAKKDGISPVTRVAMVMAKAKGNLAIADMIADKHFADDHLVKNVVKAAVSAGSTEVSAWAGNLIYPEQYAGDFIELLYPQTILGRLTLRKIPFNVRVSEMTSGTSVGWVGEGQAAPVTSAGFDKVFLTWAKVYALSVLSDELIKFSNPAAEALVQADLLKSLAKGLDLSFLSTNAAVANVSPAGLYNGVAGFAASGTNAQALINDLVTLVTPFINANVDVSTAKVIMQPGQALAISTMRNALGQKYFPDMSAMGGTLEGYTVLTSNNAPAGQLGMVIEDEVYLSEDAGPQITASTEASILMSNNPGTDAATMQPVSMFQNGLVALKIGQFINWQARRPGLCANRITGAAYVNTNS